MSRPWMPMYWGDYLQDTGHLSTTQHGAYLLLIAHCWQHGRLPETPQGRAAIARLALPQWKAAAPIIEPFFRADGTHKRIEEERERADIKITKAKIAGRKGGQKSGLLRSIRAGEGFKIEAKPKRTLEQNRSERSSENEADGQAQTQAETKRTRTNHLDSFLTTSSFVGTTREEPEPIPPAGLLASALPAGALTRPPSDEQAKADVRGKPPHALSRAELDELLASKRQPSPELKH